MNKQEIIKLWASFGIAKEDVFLMIQKVASLSSKQLFLLDEIDQKYISKIEQLFQQKNAGVPLEHLLGETDFYGYKFFVDPHTLIPKNDTEILVEKTIEYIRSVKQNFSLVDVWTGTWCIAMSILKEIWEDIWESYAIDVSPEALIVAQKNADFHELSQELKLLQWDLFIPLKNKEFQDLVVTANLPYILDNDFENIDESVIDHEPHSALFGWPKTGFELYEKLISQLQNIKAETITLFIEIGFDQWDIVRDFCWAHNIEFEIYKDNWVVERCVEMKIR